MKNAIYRVLFEFQWAWTNAFPNRMVPIGSPTRRGLKRIFDWSRT